MRNRYALAVVLAAGLLLSMGVARDETPILFEDSYGHLLDTVSEETGTAGAVALWSASSGWKVSRTRNVPAASGKGLHLALARNEREAVQLVVSPQTPLHGVTLSASALRGPEGALLSAAHVDLLRVGYVDIEVPTDYSSARAPWPDPLLPITGPLMLDADTNHPFWVRVHAPKGTPAGEYRGEVVLRAKAYTARVPLQVTVFDFALPDELTCRTAFGFNTRTLFQYHRPATEAQQRELVAKYFQNMAEHHASPYFPAPFSKFEVDWMKRSPEECAGFSKGDTELLTEYALTPRFDWTAWDREVEHAFETYHFNCIRIRIPGMRGGLFDGPRKPSLQGFEAGTRGYWLAFSQYCRKLEEHLREKCWLDDAIVYWFDEPTPHEHASVRIGSDNLKKAAPGLNRFITNNVFSEKLAEQLEGGPNIYCMIPKVYDPRFAAKRRRQGDEFWWYLCTGPKAPHPGLFIDHPGTALRVVFWQMWKHDITGFLVWRTNLWTSHIVYPDEPQNPYEDPMTWRSSNELEPGQRWPYGNGDGRFVYPPPAAADAQPGAPVLDGPVDSMRWEMIRDGLEDYEYHVLLQRLLHEKGAELPAQERARIQRLLFVPADVTTGLPGYTKDPAPMEAHRAALAEAIAALGRK